jgi:hypothetical protein
MGDQKDLNPKHQCLLPLKPCHIKDNIKISAKNSLGVQEREQHKPLFDSKCLLQS